MAHSLGYCLWTKHIEIDASGDVSAIENAKNAVEEINNAGNVQLQVSAEGDISVLDTADEKLIELVKNDEVQIKFNVDTGGFDINDLNGNKWVKSLQRVKLYGLTTAQSLTNYTAPPKMAMLHLRRIVQNLTAITRRQICDSPLHIYQSRVRLLRGLSNKNVPAAKFGSTGMFVKKSKKAKVHKFRGRFGNG